jgi:hypothetical protein
MAPAGSARRRWFWLAGAALVLVAGTAAFAWFEPDKLFVDERVDEPVPVAAGDPETTSPPTSRSTSPRPTTTVPLGPVDVLRGAFVSRDHGTTGTVRVLDVPGGGRVVRLEGLDTSNGPDLFVYLSTNPAAGEEGVFDDDYVDLGRLKGNQGDQNYTVPADVDLARYASVVIWCDRFDSAFGAADLAPA